MGDLALDILDGKHAFTTIKKEEKTVTGVPTVVSSELSLVEDMALREKLIDRIDVLDKVKKLFLIPGLEMMTLRQISEYYEVDIEVARRCYRRNKDEIDHDGVSGISAHQFMLEQDVLGKTRKGSTSFNIDGNEFDLPNTANALTFSKRAVLRIGMLLRDSEVAKEVRTQLLNAFKKIPDDVKVSDINEEESILFEYAKAMARADHNGMSNAMVKLNEYQKRHIRELQASVEEKTAYIKGIQPKIDAVEHLENMDGSVSMSSFAKSLSKNGIKVGRNRLLAWLRGKNILMKNNEPYQRYSKYFSHVNLIMNNRWVHGTQITGSGMIYVTRRILDEWDGADERKEKILNSVAIDGKAAIDASK